MARQVEPVAGQSLDKADDDIYGPGEYAAAEQGASAAWCRASGGLVAVAGEEMLVLRFMICSFDWAGSTVGHRSPSVLLVTAEAGDSSHGRGRVWRAQ